MERSHKNKENIPPTKSKPINSYYRVSKRLFECNKPENTSPVPNATSSSSPAWSEDDSPYLYEIRKKQHAAKIFIQGASTSLNSAMDETPLKRSGGFAKQRVSLCSSVKQLSCDVVMESPGSTVKKVLDKVMCAEEETTLCGDFSQECILPVIKGKHPELLTISTRTVASLLASHHSHDVTIIDCRYPYEFEAGHIKNSINLFLRENVDKLFFNPDVTGQEEKSRKLFIFYCEFSSERAPNTMRFIRNKDRTLNADKYPFVYYPEMYLVEGGYKSFFASFKDFCEPQNYKPMLTKENADDYVYYKSACKFLPESKRAVQKKSSRW